MKANFIALLIFLGGLTSLPAQSITDYYKIAEENNPGLLSKYKAFEAALQRVTQASSLPDPNLSIGYFISPVETRVGAQRAKFSLSQMFPWFGSLKEKETEASLIAESMYQDFLAERDKLFNEVANAYYPLIEIQKLIDLEVENNKILSTYKETATTGFQNNKGSLSDVLRVDIMLQDARTNLSILRNRLKPLQARFNLILNRPVDDVIILADTLSTSWFPSQYSKDSLLNDNPKINELKLRLEATKAKERNIIKSGLPQFGLGLDYVIVEERRDVNIPDNGRDILMPMLSFSLPIFRGKYKSAQKEAQLHQEVYSLQRQEYSNNLLSSYEMILYEIQTQQDLIRLYDAQTRESQRTLELVFSAYSNSGEDFEEVLRMQQQILKYQKLRTTAVVNFQLKLAELNYITSKRY